MCRAVIIPFGVLVDHNHDLYHYLWRSVVDFDSVPSSPTGRQQGILHMFVARKPRENP